MTVSQALNEWIKSESIDPEKLAHLLKALEHLVGCGAISIADATKLYAKAEKKTQF